MSSVGPGHLFFPPIFTVAAFDGPYSGPSGTPYTLTVTVTNSFPIPDNESSGYGGPRPEGTVSFYADSVFQETATLTSLAIDSSTCSFSFTPGSGLVLFQAIYTPASPSWATSTGNNSGNFG